MKRGIKIVLSLFFFLFFFASNASAETFKQWSDINFVDTIRVEGFPANNILANITITDPDSVLLVGFEPMTFNTANKTHNYTLVGSKTGKLGTYNRCITATDGSLNQTECFDFKITPSGLDGFIAYYFLIILLSYGVIVFGLWKQDISITVLGSFALSFVGLWILFFGIDIFKNYLTDGFAVITLAIAAYVSVRSAHEYIT